MYEQERREAETQHNAAIDRLLKMISALNGGGAVAMLGFVGANQALPSLSVGFAVFGIAIFVTGLGSVTLGFFVSERMHRERTAHLDELEGDIRKHLIPPNDAQELVNILFDRVPWPRGFAVAGFLAFVLGAAISTAAMVLPVGDALSPSSAGAAATAVPEYPPAK